MIANYHTHTRWCRHGEGEIEDVIRAAMEAGLEEIAISEHVPHRDNADHFRLQWEEFEDFNRELDQKILEYKGRIKVLKGLECEYYSVDLDDYRMFKEKYGYYLFLGQHRIGKDPYMGEINCFGKNKDEAAMQLYADTVCKGLESGLFSFLAHPDCILHDYNDNEWNDISEKTMRQIFACCEKTKIPVEINANGWIKGRRYPCKEAFLLSKEYDLIYLLNADAHEPWHIYDDGVKELEKEVEKWGISVTPRIDL